MFRSNWRVILAIVVGLILLASAGGYYEIDQSARPKYSQDNYQPARDPSFAEAVTGKAKPPKYDPHCQQPQNATDSDLCAQWSAVKAVEESNRLVRLNILIAYILGALGILATAVGAVLVYRSLTQSEDALNVSRDANTIAQDIAQRQLRAYVGVRAESLELMPNDESPQNFQMVFEVFNSGQSPALNVQCVVNIFVTGDHGGQATLLDRNHIVGDLGAAIGGHAKVSVPIVGILQHHFDKGKFNLKIDVKTSYHTVINDEPVTRDSVFIAAWRGPDKPVRFMAMPKFGISGTIQH